MQCIKLSYSKHNCQFICYFFKDRKEFLAQALKSKPPTKSSKKTAVEDMEDDTEIGETDEAELVDAENDEEEDEEQKLSATEAESGNISSDETMKKKRKLTDSDLTEEKSAKIDVVDDENDEIAVDGSSESENESNNEEETL